VRIRLLTPRSFLLDSPTMNESTDATSGEWLTGLARYPVYYEDTDFSGYVYHANFLKYFERGREDLVGLAFVRELYERGIHYVVARMELAFHAPARHGDIIEIVTRMRLSSSPIGIVEQEARLASSDKSPTKLVTAKIKLACVDKSGEAMRVPDDVVAHFRGLTSS
jgi:acyl-CoA thioester hydrolase